VAFAAGVLRLPVAVLQLTGRMTSAAPDWYALVQGVVGVVQLGDRDRDVRRLSTVRAVGVGLSQRSCGSPHSGRLWLVPRSADQGRTTPGDVGLWTSTWRSDSLGQFWFRKAA
jgi:hypothetical protein